MQVISRRAMLARTGVLAAGLAAGLAGCGGGSTSGLRMTWWGDPQRQRVLQRVTAMFAAKHHGTKIVREATPWGGYWDKLATQMAGRSAADWVMMDLAYLGEYADRGALSDLGPAVGHQLDLGAVPKRTVGAGRVGGKLYAVPLALNSQIVLANRDALDELKLDYPAGDMTWDEFGAFVTKVRKASGGKLAGTANPGGDMGMFEVWLRSRGKRLFGTDGTSPAFTADDLREWWAYWLGLQKSGGTVSADLQAVAAKGAADDPIVKNRAALTFNSTPMWNAFSALTPHRLVGRMLPVGDRGSGQSVQPASYFCCPASSRNLDVAAELTSFLLNDVAAAKALGLTLGVPVAPGVQQAVRSTLGARDVRTLEYVATVQRTTEAQLAPWPKGAGEVSGAIARGQQDVSFGRQSAGAAAGRAIDEANRALAR